MGDYEDEFIDGARRQFRGAFKVGRCAFCGGMMVEGTSKVTGNRQMAHAPVPGAGVIILGCEAFRECIPLREADFMREQKSRGFKWHYLAG